jgi:uncharacterized protein (DUF4415 family)
MSDESTTEAVVTTSGDVLIRQPDGSFRQAAGQTDWAGLRAMQDEDIDDSDLPELDEAFFEQARIQESPAKRQLTIRLDEDVLTWLKAQGKGYQTRINAILRAYYEAHQGARR